MTVVFVMQTYRIRCIDIYIFIRKLKMYINSIVYCIFIGLCTYSLSDLVGIGGGIVMVLLMLLLFPSIKLNTEAITLAV